MGVTLGQVCSSLFFLAHKLFIDVATFYKDERVLRTQDSEVTPAFRLRLLDKLIYEKKIEASKEVEATITSSCGMISRCPGV